MAENMTKEAVGYGRVVKERYHYVREVFFSHWDSKEWRVIFPSHRNVDGHCDTESKIIEIGIVLKDKDDIDCLLIHEICHTLSGCAPHGITWKRTMLKKADIAERKGRTLLAVKIRKDVDAYSLVEELGIGIHAEIYDSIDNAVLNNAEISYDDVIQYISHYYGLMPHEIEAQFKKSKKVFETAKKKYLPLHFRRTGGQK